MKFIDFEKLKLKSEIIKNDYQSKKPFRYTMFDDFFKPDMAELVYNSYPTIKEGKWDNTTYINQKNKFQKTSFDEGSTFDNVFKELNSYEFVKWLEHITEIKDLIIDDKLFGGGLHQSIKGAFLNVHVDYNIHPETKKHRRVNVLVFMNKDWKEEYEGHLELWDLTGKKKLLEKFLPSYNRCVIFETNEISFHGHPKPLQTPDHINRKSLATYYYTDLRPVNEITTEHNTIYINTEGLTGKIKRFNSGIKAFYERFIKKR